MRELVSWTVEDRPPGVRVAGALASLVGAVAAVATLGTTTGARTVPTWSLPADPEAYLDLGPLRARGDARWLPGRPGRRHALQATRGALLVVDRTGRRPPVPVPLPELRITSAACRAPGRPARHPDAPWTLTLTGAGTAEVDGAWLALAWIGRLAGWPEPPA